MTAVGGIRVVLAGGGTGGHVIPAIAVAQEVTRRGGEARFVGTADRLEARLVPQAGYEIDYVELVDGATMKPVREAAGTVLLAAAGKLGTTRLIDNVAFEAGPEGVAETLLEFPGWSRYEW